MLAGQPWRGGSKVGLHFKSPFFCGCMSCCCCCCCCREETEGRTALYYIIQCVTQGDRLELPSLHDLQAQGLAETLAQSLLQLTLQCWAQLPVERPTMTEVRQPPCPQLLTCPIRLPCLCYMHEHSMPNSTQNMALCTHGTLHTAMVFTFHVNMLFLLASYHRWQLG